MGLPTAVDPEGVGRLQHKKLGLKLGTVVASMWNTPSTGAGRSACPSDGDTALIELYRLGTEMTDVSGPQPGGSCNATQYRGGRCNATAPNSCWRYSCGSKATMDSATSDGVSTRRSGCADRQRGRAAANARVPRTCLRVCAQLAELCRFAESFLTSLSHAGNPGHSDSSK